MLHFLRMIRNRANTAHEANLRILRERFAYEPTDCTDRLAVAGAVRYFSEMKG